MEMVDKNAKKRQRQTYPPREICGTKNHPTERCWRGAGDHLRVNRTRQDDKTSSDEGK